MGIKPPMDKTKARKLLLEIKETFDNLKIKFWLASGTCLGAVREGRFIPCDWDLDAQMLARDLSPKVCETLGKVASYKLYVFWKGKPAGLLLRRDQIAVHIKTRYYFAPKDIYITFLPKRLHYYQTAMVLGKWLRGDYWVHFLDTKFRVPNPPGEYLEHLYGKNWRIPFDPHKTNKQWQKEWKQIPTAEFEKYAQWIKEHPKEVLR